MISQQGVLLIMELEGLRLKAYRCSANVWTIGFGHTEGVTEGHTCSLEQAYRLLWSDINECIRVIHNVKVPLTYGMVDALCSFIFNVGRHAFLSSTMFRVLNAGKYDDASRQFDRWVMSKGKVLPGLVARRRREKGLFLKDGLIN